METCNEIQNKIIDKYNEIRKIKKQKELSFDSSVRVLRRISDENLKKFSREFYAFITSMKLNILGQIAPEESQAKSTPNFIFLKLIFKEDCKFTCFYPECSNLRSFNKNAGGYLVLKFCEKHSTKEYRDLYRKITQKGKKVSKETVQKRKETWLKKYGVDNPMKAKEIQAKVSNTWYNKNVEEKEEILKRREKTSLEKYGVKNPNQSQLIINKRALTNLIKYGAKTWPESEEYLRRKEEIFEKRKKTSIEKYGVEHIMKSEEKEKKDLRFLKNGGKIYQKKKKLIF